MISPYMHMKCDFCGTKDEIPMITSADYLKRAKKFGWKKRDGKDWCGCDNE